MVIFLPKCHINVYPGGWVLTVAQVLQIQKLLQIPELLPVLGYRVASTPLDSLYSTTAYNPQTTNNFSQVIPLIHQTVLVQIPKSVCTLINEVAEKQNEEHVTDEDIKTKYLDIILETSDIATVTTSDHCELTQALNAIRSGLTLVLVSLNTFAGSANNI